MRHLRILLSAAIIALFGGSLLAQTQTTTYYMNGEGSPVDFTATNVGPIPVTATNFTAAPLGVAVPGTTIPGHAGPGSPNQALQYDTGVNWSFGFSITNNAAGFGALSWEISSFDFDINTASGVSGNFALFVDQGSGFVQKASGTIGAVANPIWRGIGTTVSPTFIIDPLQSANFRIDFSGFSTNNGIGNGTTYAIDNVDVTGGAFVAVPEPASIAAIGFTGTLLTCGLYARNRRKTKLKRKTRNKQTNTAPVLAR